MGRYILRMAEVRQRLNVSQGELSKRTGIAVQAISRHENGHHALSAETAMRYADALGVTVNELFVVNPDAQPNAPDTGAESA